MPPRAGLTRDRVVEAALAVIDDSGPEGLTLARVAGHTGVATPSLYKHVPGGLSQLRHLVRLRVLVEFGETLRTATIGRARDEALRSMATAYRRYIHAYPHRYPFVETAPTDPEGTAAANRVVEVVYAVIRGYGLEGADAIHAIRCTRAAIHGFAHLEAIGGFQLPEKIDDTFEHLLEMMTSGLTRLAETAPPNDQAAGGVALGRE